MTLGYLAWWRVADTSLDQDTATAIADKLGIKAPSRPAPVDVFRKLAGAKFADREGDDVVELRLHPVESQRTMRVRHIVKHTSRASDKAGGLIPVSHDRVGEAVFYKPPRARPSKARLRITLNDPNDEWLARYAEALRQEYNHHLVAFDVQAVRRLVRLYLASVQALYIDGVYFLREKEHVDNLMWLFSQLGGDCRCYETMLLDNHTTRAMLGDALERAVADGSKTDLLEAYIPLGVVPDSLWEKLETS